MNDDAINEMLHSLAHCETFAGSRRVVRNFLDTYEQSIIAAFLERTGQYITNDASREAAIVEALASREEAPATSGQSAVYSDTACQQTQARNREWDAGFEAGQKVATPPAATLASADQYLVPFVPTNAMIDAILDTPECPDAKQDITNLWQAMVLAGQIK